MGSVATLLADHVDLRVTCVDRLFIAGYVPQLQTEGQVIRFLLQRGYRIPSPAGLGHNHDRLVADIEAFVAATKVPVVRFTRGASKEDTARPFLDAAEREQREGVVLVGKAQERVAGWRGFKDPKHPASKHGHPHFVYRRQALFVDHWYFYVFDHDWGPGFIKVCPYAPYPIWVWCNGHEWAKRQLVHAGIGFRALDNGFAAVDDPAALHRLCGRLGAGHVRRFLDKWLAVLPSAFTPEDRAAGFGYDFSVRQFELSDTAMFDRPRNGRAWFEAAIRDHLDLGRPEQVTLIVNRRIYNHGSHRTPGRFETRVVTRDVDPQIQIRYQSSKVKAYFKEQRALRVETTINDPYNFGVKRRLTSDNWRGLRRAALECNDRFLAALGEGEPPAPDATTLEQVVLPSTDDGGLRAPGFRFGDPRVMALLASVAAFAHVLGGLTNPGLRDLMAGLWRPDYSTRQATYDLRRLRRKGFIERIDHTHTYRVTPRGRRIAAFFTKLAARAVVPTLTELEAPLRPHRPAPGPVVVAWHAYEHEIRALLDHANLN